MPPFHRRIKTDQLAPGKTGFVNEPGWDLLLLGLQQDAAHASIQYAGGRAWLRKLSATLDAGCWGRSPNLRHGAARARGEGYFSEHTIMAWGWLLFLS